MIISTFNLLFISNLRIELLLQYLVKQPKSQSAMEPNFSLLDEEDDSQPCLINVQNIQPRKKAKPISPKETKKKILLPSKKNSPKMEQKQNGPKSSEVLSPRSEPEICLLHSSPVELICLQDKCLICCKCALFGQHKGHNVQNREGLVSKLTLVVQNCLQIYEELKEKQNDCYGQKSQNIWKEKAEKQKNLLIKRIANSFEELYEQMKKVQKLCLNKVEMSYKSQLKAIADGGQCQLNKGIDKWYQSIQAMGQILDDVSDLKKISEGIQYLKQGQDSLLNLGQLYLIQLIDQHNQYSEQLEKDIYSIQLQIDSSIKKGISKYCVLREEAESSNTSIAKTLKEMKNSCERQCKGKSSEETRAIREDDFMLLSLQVDSFATSFEAKQIGPEGLPSLSISHIQTVNQSQFFEGTKSEQDRSMWFKQSNTTQPYKKKKKNLEVPEKFKGTIEDLKNDRADVIDLTGAELGDSNIFSLCQYIKKSKKVRVLKLIRNKMSDDCFMQLLQACKDTKISSLNVSQNSLTDKAVNMIQQAELKKLRNITLSLNKINRRNVKVYIDALSKKGITLSI